MIKKPEELYKKLQKGNKEAISYHNLIQFTENKHGWTIPKEVIINEHKEKPSQFIQRTLEQNGHGCTKVWAGTNPKKPSKFVLNLRFSNEQQTSEFKKFFCERNTTISADKKTLTLTQETISEILNKLSITHYDTTNPAPIMQSLQQEHRQQTTLNPAIGFFYTPEKENLVDQLIKTLIERPQADTSFFHKSLINFLKELPSAAPSQLMTKIKKFTHAISTHAVEKDQHTELLINLILDPETRNLCDLIDKLREYQETPGLWPEHS